LIFIPTTIFDMVWGVRFIQDGYGFDYGDAVLRASAVPFGWIIGCPLLGYISDRTGRRKPVIIGGTAVLLLCLAGALYGRVGIFPPYSIALLIGIASGAGMIPYTVIKESNPPHLSGTATGVANFINFTFSAMMGQIFGWLLLTVSHGSGKLMITDYRMTFGPLLFGLIVAIIMTLFLKETGRSSTGARS
jgi:MFS family permease